MTKKLVWLIRHGQTTGNAEKRYIGKRTDEPLSAAGVHAAETFGELLAAECDRSWREVFPKLPISLRICTGPLQRTRQTAEILEDALSKTLFSDGRMLPAAVIGSLTEIDFGRFEGKNYKELNGDPLYQSWIDSGGRDPFPEGESREEFVQRSWQGFLEALGDIKKEEAVILVCHGGNIKSVMERLTGEDYFSFLTVNLGGYRVVLETEDAGITHCTYHRIDGRPDP